VFSAIVQANLRQRVLVLIVSTILLVWGWLVARDMPIDLLPETRPPSVVLTAESGTLTAEEVEQLVVIPIEQALAGLSGVTSVRSGSNASVAYFQVVFAWGSDTFRNRQLVVERLQSVRGQLPDGVEPTLAPMSAATGLIMHMGVTGGDNPMALREYVDWVVRPRLLAVEGVSQVFAIGGQVRTYQFTPNLDLMQHFGVTLSDVEAALRRFASNTSGGVADVQGTSYALRNISRTGNLDDMRGLVVAYRDRAPVLLGQVGEVVFAAAVRQGQAAFNGRASVNLSIIKQPQANTVRVSDRIQAAIRELRSNAPAGVELGMVSFSQADMIKEAIDNVGDVLRDAVVIVTIVLILFLGAWRPTFISLLAIPASLMISALVFHIMGLSLNTMTLGGIAIGIGALVDDAVVNVENIMRRLGENRRAEHPRPATAVIVEASNEVRSGIVYATAVVLVVFIPLLAMPGQVGRMFVPLATAFIVSIVASLVVSITLTPALCSYLIPRMRALDREHGGAFARWLKRWNNRALVWVLDHPKPVFGCAAVSVLLAILSVPFLPRSFLPQLNEGNVYVTLLLAPDTSIAESYRVGHIAEQLLLDIPEVKALSRRSGRYDGDSDVDPVNANEMPLRIVLDQGRSLKELMAEVRRRISIFPGEVNVTRFLLERMQSQDNMVRGDIVVKVFGRDLPTIRIIAERFKAELSRVPGLVDLAVEQQSFVPQQRITVDYQRAALFGVTPAEVTERLGALANGQVVSQVIENGRRFDVVIRLRNEDRDPSALERMRVDTPDGPVPLASFASVVGSVGPSRIMHEDGQRRIAVMANSDGSQDLAAIAQRAREIVERTRLPQGYRVVLDGDFRQGEEARVKLALLSPVALFLMYMLLHQRFRSAVLCLVIMGNIPLALVGAVVAVWLAGLDLDLAALIGFIAVTGVAVRNSLLKVSHFINLHLHEDMPIGRELVLRGSAERLMPVLMTALAAGLALTPLLWTSDRAGTEILHPVAVAIFGGLISATLLDAFTTPLLFERLGEKALRKVIAANEKLAYETF
jgi:HME family heavy-metal exporter